MIVTAAAIILLRDFMTHRISNWLSALFLFFLLFDTHMASLVETCIAILITITGFYLGGIGMGDIKLAIAIIATQGSLVLAREFFTLSLLALLATVLFRFLKYRHLRGSVAFSQVLLLPFLLLYLAI